MVIPTASQIAIRDTVGLGLMVVAPAGCGKTEALALRVVGLLDRAVAAPPRRILVTTFSNRARDNIKERLGEYLSPSVMRDRVTVVNYHGLSARIFGAHAAVIGQDPELIRPDSDWVAEQCRSMNLAFSTAAVAQSTLQLVKQQPLTDDQVLARLQEIGDPASLHIEELRRKEGRLTYDDLPRMAELILQNTDVAQLYQNHFGSVLVDEFQDLTPQQLRIVNVIGFGRTTYAGDLAQGIYGFAGASPVAVHEAILAECSERIDFSDSYRSSPAVLELLNSLSHRTGGHALSCADPASWPGGGLAGSVTLSSARQEATWATGFAQFVLERAPGHRIGVISRTRSRRRFVDETIASSGLEFHRWDDAILDTDTARRVSGLLALLDVAEFEEAPDPLDFLRAAASIEKIQDPSSREYLSEALSWCCDALRDGQSPDDIKSRIRIGDSGTLLSVPGVHLLTGHVGKGQQFDWIVVIGAEDGCIPDFRAKTADEIDEEARVFSVMLSRARHGAVILSAKSVEAATTGVPYSKNPSRFLNDFSGSPGFSRDRQIRDWLESVSWDEVADR